MEMEQEMDSFIDHFLKLGFEDLETDEDCFAWTVQHLGSSPVHLQYGPAGLKHSPKSAEESEKRRIEGNKYFKSKLYKNALDMYTKSMIAAPAPDKEHNGDRSLAKSLSNRSAALFHLKEYEACLIDIEDAIQAGFMEERQYLLYDRKVKCLNAMQLHAEAMLAFDKAAELLSKSEFDADQQTKILKELGKHIGDSTALPNPNANHHERVQVGLPCLPHGRNASHPSLSASCKVMYDTDKGRYVVATRDIRPGEVILVEEPYCSLLHNDSYGDYCDNCCRKLPIAPISCQNCTKVLFCSSLCRGHAWDHYHKYMCPMETSVCSNNPAYHLAFKTVLVTGLDELLKYTNTSTASGTMHGDMAGCNEQGQYKSNDFNTIKHLVDHFDKLSKRQTFEITSAAVSYTRSLDNIDFFQSIPPEEKPAYILCVGKCLMHIIQAVIVNSATIQETVCSGTSFVDPKYDNIGIGLYPTYDLFNHSCAGNVLRVSYANDIVGYAQETIKEGEEVTAMYGFGYGFFRREERQLKLQQTYHFKCSCEACIYNWPLYSTIRPQAPQFKCKYCRHPLPISTGSHPRTGKVCPSCRQRTDVPATTPFMSDCLKRHQEAAGLLSARRFNEALLLFKGEMERLENLLVIPRIQPGFLMCKATLGQCCSLMGNMHIDKP